jgi:hypothetical protein
MQINLDFALDPEVGQSDAEALETWRAAHAPQVRAVIDFVNGGGAINVLIDGDIHDVVRAVQVYCGDDHAQALDLIAEYARA